jgi:hypothetical protein
MIRCFYMGIRVEETTHNHNITECALMKTFKKIALVSAIATAPFMAQAELVSMDEALMGETTGQAGVTIEIELGAGGIDIGSVVYTDEGSVTLENINIGLAGTITQTVDVNAAGDLEITSTAPGSVAITMGGTEFSALKLGGTNGDSEIIGDLNLAVTLGASTTTIMSLGTDATGLGALGNAGVTDTAGSTYSTDVSSMAIVMSTTLEVTDLDVGVFGYTRAQADGISIAAGGAAGDAASDLIAAGSAIEISDVTISGAGGGAMTMDQTIWAVGGDASAAGSTAGVYIQMGALNADINVGGIAIGGASIGQVAINGLSMAGMTQRIYGH